MTGSGLSGLLNLFPEPDYEHDSDNEPDQLAYPAESAAVSASPAHHVSVVIHHGFIIARFIFSAGLGFEPRFYGSEPHGLPLADPAIITRFNVAENFLFDKERKGVLILIYVWFFEGDIYEF